MMRKETDKLLTHALITGALGICLALAGCGSGTPPRVAVFALDGPPLALSAAQGEVELLEESGNDPADVVAGEFASGGTGGSGGTYASGPAEGLAEREATQAGGKSGGALNSEPGLAAEAATRPVPSDSESSPAPAVAVAPRYRIVNETRFTGEMERGLLAGIGRFKLENPETGLICEGNVDSAPSRRGRIRGIVPCGEGEFFMFTLSHQGPDQGAGIGRFASGQGTTDEPESLELETQPGPPVLFFYHPWAEEAERRLTDMQKNLAAHIKDGRKKEQREE